MSTQLVVDDKTKEMYYLSFISNITGNYIVDKVSTLEKRARNIENMVEKGTLLTILKDKWKVVWGPCIQIASEEGSWQRLYLTDNLMYAAQNESTGDYFVGIAGTNPVSENGWFEQDFKVEKTVSWSYNAEHGQISEGTSIGLNNLKGLVDKKKKTTLLDFLKKEIKGKTCEVAFGGHSLGGALSPTLAVAFKDLIQSDSKYNGVSVAAYPTAGPTPGDEKFATYMSRQLDKYIAVNNTKDAVPRAWDLKDLKDLPCLYVNCTDLPIAKNRIIENFTCWAMDKPNTTYARPQKDVIVWDNGCMTKDDNEDPLVKKIKEGILDNMLKNVKDELEIINQKPLEDEDMKGFKFFLSTLASQHTKAYSSPEENGFQLDKDFLKEYKGYTTPENLVQVDRAIKNGTRNLDRLVKEVAEWVKETGGCKETKWCGKDS